MANSPQPVVVGAAQPAAYLPKLQDKKVAVVVNHTSYVGEKHLVDLLLEKGVTVQKIFAPEHGYRGNQEAEIAFGDEKDPKTGLPVVSLYGKMRKPTQAMLEDVDVVVFDIQDVGVRCYTYLSTLHNVMEACIAYQRPVVVLDRPNPNGHYIDGPILDLQFQSFVGKHPIPLVYGLTIGELACMINGEGWLQNQQHCDLTVIPLQNYTHQTPYSLPIRPSPNLPNDQAVALYPTLVLFEGTTISVGRGTPFPFQVIGYPDSSLGDFQFTPDDHTGNVRHPQQRCYGVDLRTMAPPHRLDLQYLLRFYRLLADRGKDLFGPTFDIHAGSDLLRQQMEQGLGEEAIRASWQPGLEQYRAKRQKYLLYN
ncbi:MAG: DUF1343 domain-containing protein [Roseivirga sp.]